MNAGNVAAFACRRPHPQLGDDVPCLRSRHHAGDHQGEHDGSLKTWPDPPLRPWLDPPAGETPVQYAAGGIVSHPRRAGKTSALEALELDEQTETVTMLERVGRVAPPWLMPYAVGWLSALGVVAFDRWLP